MAAKREVPRLSLLSYVQGTPQDKISFVDDLFSGLKDYGFIVLTDHTVDQEKVDRTYDLFHQFFNFSDEKKREYLLEGASGQRGYTSFGQEHAKGNEAPDLKEFWHVGREIPSEHPFKKYYPDNVWIKELPEFKATCLELYNSMDATAGLLLNALGKALDLPENYFKEMIEAGNSILRVIHYPPMDSVGEVQGSVRAAAHEDINLITMLVGATASGLQLLDRDGTWLDVESNPGELVVDSGDMLSRICNEVIPATTHRVINPEVSSTARYSMPFFVHPHPEAKLSCIPSCRGDKALYPDISSHDFLMQRLQEIGLK